MVAATAAGYPAPRTPIDPDSPAYAEAIVRAALRRAAAARQDPSRFYETVMREETTRARIRTLPHQRLLFEFVDRYPKCVVREPVGASKTYTMAALTLKYLGEDPTSRGAIISSTQTQASKPLLLVRDYIERSPDLRLVYPTLLPSRREGDPWTQTAITVDRPYGIRDPSLVAVGVDGAIPGARLNWCVVDDILSLENTATPESREHVRRWFASTVVPRLDVKGSRLVVTNTPWVGPTSSDLGDLTYFLEAKGWPTLTIDVWGNVWIANADDFDSDEIRPANDCEGPTGRHRLTAHDDPEVLRAVYGREGMTPPDPANDADEYVTFWPGKYGHPEIREIQKTTTPREFAQNYEMRARGESEDRVNEVWIRDAKTAGQRMGFHHFFASAEDLRQFLASRYSDDAYGDPAMAQPPTLIQNVICATGADLAIGKKKTNARTVIFTIAVLPPDNKRLVVNIQGGRWSGKEIVLKMVGAHTAFESIVRIENNAGQDFLKQWVNDFDASCPTRAHTTGKNKADPTHGVESILIELEQGAWILPCDARGKSPPEVEAWLQDLRTYAPGAHTGDYLMASWFADWQAKKQGAFLRGKRAPSLAGLHYR